MPKIFQSILVAITCASLIGCSNPTNSTNLTLQDMNCESSNIIIKTSLGDMQAELYPELVPDTVKNFCYHIAEKNYDDIVFHRVIKDFMVQTGDFENHNGTGGYSYKGPGTNIPEEFHPELQHDYGVLSMANTGMPVSTGSQFFIVQAKQGTSWLDNKHSVFGKVTEGLEILEQIATAETGAMDRPREEITIYSIEFL